MMQCLLEAALCWLCTKSGMSGAAIPHGAYQVKPLAIAYEKNYAWVFGQEQLLNKRCKHTRTVKILRKNTVGGLKLLDITFMGIGFS